MKKETLNRLFFYLLRKKLLVILIVFSSICYALLTLTSPLLIGKIMDLIIATDFSTFFMFLFLLLTSYILLFISDFFVALFSTNLATTVAKLLRKEMFHKLVTIPFSLLDHTPLGEITNRFSIDTDNIMNGIIQSLPRLFIGFTSILVSIFIMFYLNTTLAILLIITGPIMYYLSKFITLNTNRFYITQTNQTSHLNSYAEEIITGIKTIKNFSYESTSKLKFEKYNKQLYHSSLKANFYSSLSHPVTRLVSNTAYILIGVVGAYLSSKGSIGIGDISTFLLYTTLFTRPFSEITSVIAELQLSLASSKRIFEFLDHSPEIDSGKQIPSTFEGNIEFHNVDFSYTKETTFITNFNLFIPKGTTTAIVGKTGSGKTTIVNLLMRFYEIQKGSIYIDGINIIDIPKTILRKNIGIVLQDTKLFSGTIRDNIAYGMSDISEEKMKQAAILAHANSFIQRLPEGYHTYITSDTFSEGETQLITIARTLLTNPPILILDEATSNIDLLTEYKIQQAFQTLIQNTTSFIIAHRLSTIQSADLILYIENGNIAEKGTHEELLQKKGKYFELYQSQFKNQSL